jgi:uncharacterized membrane protein
VNDAYPLVKTLHILSATILFGTGLGTAFHMWMTHLSGDVRAIAMVSRNVVRADFLFTTPAVIVQPLSGAALIWMTAADSLAPWLVTVYALYALTGLCWLPVVRLQIRIRNLACAAAETGTALPPLYYRAMRIWFMLGWPAFIAIMAILWLMVAKPPL